jgi:hypothetical protein
MGSLNKINIWWALCLVFCHDQVFAQNYPFVACTFPVVEMNQPLKYTYSGGVNAPQFSVADLNADMIEDLVIFDRVGYNVQTYIGTNTEAYNYAPQYAANFPPLSYWVLLRDYNHDGAMDIFTAGSTSIMDFTIKVYTGFFQDNELRFMPAAFAYPGCTDCIENLLYYRDQNGQNWLSLTNSLLSYPAIDDIDSDGDLDFLAFEQSLGSYLVYYKNMAIESGLGSDTIILEVASTCWGGFADLSLSGCRKNLAAAPDSCAQDYYRDNQIFQRTKNEHPGASILTYDIESDGDKDLFMGVIGANCLGLMTNNGTLQKAWMTEQDTFFPSYGTSVNMHSFVGAYAWDTNQDAQLDLVVAPNGFNFIEDKNCVWRYLRENNQLNLIEKNYLVKDMIDVGTGAHPAFMDANGDGLTDLVIGNTSLFSPQNPRYSTLTLYLNKGTATAPAFELASNDWLSFSQLNPADQDYAPAAFDIDQDGDDDLIAGSASGKLYYCQNEAAQGNPGIFAPIVSGWQGIDPGISSSPCFYDIDDDGLADLLLGERQGNINFYKNIGSASVPAYSIFPDVETLGSANTIIAPFSFGNSAPVIVRLLDGRVLLLTGSYEGSLLLYQHPLANTDTLLNIANQWGGIRTSRRTSPALADLDNDGLLELALGLQTGGIQLYKTDLKVKEVSDVNPITMPSAFELKIFPSIAKSVLNIHASEPIQWVLLNSTGIVVDKSDELSQNAQISVSTLPNGIYFIKGTTSIQTEIQSFIIAR